MVNWDVTVGEIELTEIFDVNYNRGRSQQLGEAVIVCGNSGNNRLVESGDEIIVYKNGQVDFRGYVTGKPTKAGATKTEIEIQAVDKRMELKHQQVKRVFYQMDTAEIVRRAIDEKATSFDFPDTDPPGNYLFTGDTTTGWETDISRFSLGDILSVSLQRGGADFLFFGWPEDSQGQYHATFSDFPSDALPSEGGRLDTLFTRLAINNSGELFDVEIDFRDNAGNNYIWELDIPESGFEQYELKAEQAVGYSLLSEESGVDFDPVSSDNTIEYRIRTRGSLPGARAMGLDYTKVVPFDTTSRTTDIKTGQIENTGRVITRRVEESVFKMINELATEEQFISFIDLDDFLHYEPEGQDTAKSIRFEATDNEDATAVIDAEFNRDYQDITNRVIVQGEGDIQHPVEDADSINFYGVTAREEPIVDDSIQTIDEAIARGEGYLKKHARNDEAIRFVIADSSFQSLQFGDDILISWPPEDIFGTYTVTNVESDRDGIVTVDITQKGMV